MNGKNSMAAEPEEGGFRLTGQPCYEAQGPVSGALCQDSMCCNPSPARTQIKGRAVSSRASASSRFKTENFPVPQQPTLSCCRENDQNWAPKEWTLPPAIGELGTSKVKNGLQHPRTQLQRKGKRPAHCSSPCAPVLTLWSENHRRYRAEQEMCCFSLIKAIDSRQTECGDCSKDV